MIWAFVFNSKNKRDPHFLLKGTFILKIISKLNLLKDKCVDEYFSIT